MFAHRYVNASGTFGGRDVEESATLCECETKGTVLSAPASLFALCDESGICDPRSEDLHRLQIALVNRVEAPARLRGASLWVDRGQYGVIRSRHVPKGVSRRFPVTWMCSVTAPAISQSP